MRFEYTDGTSRDFIELCHGLDDFLNEAVGGEENRAGYIPYNSLDDILDVIVAYDGDFPVGAASFKRYDDEFAEVKRIFVRTEYRGKGISKRLMLLLEDSARKQGYRYLILENRAKCLPTQWHSIEKSATPSFRTTGNTRICRIRCA